MGFGLFRLPPQSQHQNLCLDFPCAFARWPTAHLGKHHHLWNIQKTLSACLLPRCASQLYQISRKPAGTCSEIPCEMRRPCPVKSISAIKDSWGTFFLQVWRETTLSRKFLPFLKPFAMVVVGGGFSPKWSLLAGGYFVWYGAMSIWGPFIGAIVGSCASCVGIRAFFIRIAVLVFQPRLPKIMGEAIGVRPSNNRVVQFSKRMINIPHAFGIPILLLSIGSLKMRAMIGLWWRWSIGTSGTSSVIVGRRGRIGAAWRHCCSKKSNPVKIL